MPNITFKGKHEKSIEVTCGPGHYDQTEIGKDSNHETGFKYTMRGKSKEVKIAQSVGPGQYDINTQPIEERAAKWTMVGRNERVQQDITPSPGHYDPSKSVELTMPKGQMFTMRAKLREPRRDVSPSPNLYNPGGEFGQDLKPITMAGKARDATPDMIPGPGQYQPNKNVVLDNMNKTVDFGKGQKERMKIMASQTGDISGGNYDIVKPFGHDGQKIKMKGKSKFKPLNDNPAPTHYYPEDK